MANIPEEIIDGSITQLTRSISEGVRVYVPGGDRFVSRVRGVMANGVSESIPQGMNSNVVANGVSESISQGMD
ncbi:hypothetical protein Tco_0455061, partial [Tanacetum coccineum]